MDCDARTAPGKANTSPETRFLRLFYRAAQRYGLIMLDGSGDNSLGVYLESDITAGWIAVIGEQKYGSYAPVAPSRPGSRC